MPLPKLPSKPATILATQDYPTAGAARPATKTPAAKKVAAPIIEAAIAEVAKPVRNAATKIKQVAALMVAKPAPAPAPVAAAPVETASLQASATDTALDDAAPLDNQIEPAALQYAQVTKVAPITNKDKVYATVIGSEPVRETTTTSVPHEVCEDVVVEERLPERDGNTGGTVAGAGGDTGSVIHSP